MSSASYNSDRAADHANPRVAEWLSKAIGDLHVAERLLRPDDPRSFDAVCFHAQQGAEKLLKAALESRAVRFPKVHDLVHLQKLLQFALPSFSFDVDALSELSTMAVESRYPGSSMDLPATRAAFATAVRLWDALRPLI